MGTVSQDSEDLRRRAVTLPYPYHFWRSAIEKAHLVEVRVLRHDHIIMVSRVRPHLGIRGQLEIHVTDVRRLREEGKDLANQTQRQILVQEQLHEGGRLTNLRSRSAANARQARISSRVRSGKSERIWSSDIPEAKYSRTSYTVIHSPRIHGLPPRLPGSMVMKRL